MFNASGVTMPTEGNPSTNQQRKKSRIKSSKVSVKRQINN